MTTSAIKARLAKLEAALCPPLVIEVDPDTLPDDDERDQGEPPHQTAACWLPSELENSRLCVKS